MKIPPIAIKSIKPYAMLDHKIQSFQGHVLLALEIELNEQWLKIFKSFKGDISIKINQRHNYLWFYARDLHTYGIYSNSHYIYKIYIKDVTEPVPSKFRYKPNLFSKTKFTKSIGIKNRIIKSIASIKLSNKTDIAKLKMISRSSR